MRSILFIAICLNQTSFAYENTNIDFGNQPYPSYEDYTKSKKSDLSSWYKACAVTGVALGTFAVCAFSDTFAGGNLSPATFLIAGAAGTATFFVYDIANK